MPYKISIIIPVYNAEDTIKTALDSIINQTIGVGDLQVIMVNDKSTDDNRTILEDYSKKYPNFELINIEENIGASYGLKNIALQYVKSPYIMFLDVDGSYENNTCEMLYKTIEKEKVDIVFGRYKRIYKVNNLKSKKHYITEDNELIQKSHSVFMDNLSDYTDDIIDNVTLNGIRGLVWRKFISRLIYGKTHKNPNCAYGFYMRVRLKKLTDNVDILRSLPSVWTKIYKTDLILENNIQFPELISTEDLNFLMDAYFHADGILFLNNKFVYNHYMGATAENKSINKNINFKVLYDSLRGYNLCLKLCNKYSFKDVEIILNPFLLNFISLFKQANLNNDEKKILIDEFEDFKKEYNCGWKGNLICFFILKMLNR